jgi:hypothetical protein
MHSQHRTFRHLAAPVALLLTVILAACGSDSALSESEYLQQGNAICEKSAAQIAEATKTLPTDRPPTVDEFNKVANDTLLPNIRKQIDDLAKLDPPSNLDDAADQMITSARAELAKMEADIKADPEAFMNNEADPFADTNAKANAIGLTVCGNP